jgi:hypothetical protein
VASFTSEERQSFYGSIARDMTGAEHLFGLTSAETEAYLSFRRTSLAGAVCVIEGIRENIRLYDKHRRACKVRWIEPTE